MSELIWTRTPGGYTAKGFERRYYVTREGARAWNLREESAGVLATTATLKDAQAIAEADAIAARAEERAKWEEHYAREDRAEHVESWRAGTPEGYELARVTLDVERQVFWAYVPTSRHWNGFEIPAMTRGMILDQAGEFAREFPADAPAHDFKTVFTSEGREFSLWCQDEIDQYGEASGECFERFDVDGRELFNVGNGWTWNRADVEEN